MGSSRLQPGAASLPALQTSKLQLEDEDVLLPISYGTVAPADSASDSQQRQLATDGKTFASALIAFLGSGVLGFPYAFKETGILLGIGVLVLVAALSTFCMLLVVDCKYKLKAQGLHVTKYGDIGYAAMGHAGRVLVTTSLVLAQTGFAVAYLIFIAANAHTYFSVSREAVVLVCLPFLMGFSLLRHMKQLAYPAILADLMNFTGLAIVYVTDFSLINVDAIAQGSSSSINWLGALSNAPFFFGVASYCFGGVGMVLPLENAMANKTHFPRVLKLTIALITFVFASFGICGYLAFGQATQDLVTLNIEGHGAMASSVKLLICAGLFFAYPMMLFPVFEALEVVVLRTGSRQHAEMRMTLFRAGFVLLTGVIAAAVPNFGLFISFLGSTCCALLGFVLPVTFHMQICDSSSTSRSHRVALYCILLLEESGAEMAMELELPERRSAAASAPPPQGASVLQLHTVDLEEEPDSPRTRRKAQGKTAIDDVQGHLSSDVRTFGNTVISFLGSGVLGLPFAFKKCGILLGLVTLVTVAAVSTYAMLLVVRCKYRLKAQGKEVSTYGEIGHVAMGRLGSTLVNSCLVISQTGFCVAYLIFISTNAHQFLGVSKELIVSACVPPLIAFSLLKHMKELAFVALLADAMNFTGLAVVYATDLSYMATDYDNIEMLGVISSIPFFFGVASYCFEGVGMVLPLENSMQTKAHFTPILVATVVIITTIYATFGICGYLAFGDATQDVITLNIEGHGSLATTVKLLLCLALFFTYPVMLFPVFEVLQPLVMRSRKHDESAGDSVPQESECKSVTLRSCVVLITALVAACVPNFGSFISFIGSTCCSLLAFVLPCVFYQLICQQDDAKTATSGFKLRLGLVLERLLQYGLIVVGLAAVIAGVYECAQSFST